jgi:hypothetical protein
MYPEYTGTALVATLKDTEPAPDTPEATYERARELYSQREPADTMLTPADFNNSYGIVVVREVAEEMNLQTLDDLAEASPRAAVRLLLRVPEPRRRLPEPQGELPGLRLQGHHHRQRPNLRYRGLAEDQADVGHRLPHRRPDSQPGPRRDGRREEHLAVLLSRPPSSGATCSKRTRRWSRSSTTSPPASTSKPCSS